jgi:hypothetical protein
LLEMTFSVNSVSSVAKYFNRKAECYFFSHSTCPAVPVRMLHNL